MRNKALEKIQYDDSHDITLISRKLEENQILS